MSAVGQPDVPVAFISCDWGTSQFRLAWVKTGGVVQSVQLPQGVGVIRHRRDFPRVLAQGLHALSAPPGLPVMISGMASSSIGWCELPYAPLPFSLTGCDAVWTEVQPNVFLISGVAGDNDIMRGEETQLLGMPMTSEAFVILPGTHSKHARVCDGKLVSFQTYMTGELFAATAKHTVLVRSVAVQASFDHRAFVEGVEAAQRVPISAALFHVRGRDVLHGVSQTANRSYLSGVWVGAELADLPDDIPIWVCAAAELAPAYVTALQVLGRSATVLPPQQVELLAMRGQAVLLQKIQGVLS